MSVVTLCVGTPDDDPNSMLKKFIFVIAQNSVSSRRYSEDSDAVTLPR